MLTVTIYTTGPGCGQCMLTKRVLEGKGIDFNEVDIREHAGARDYVTEDLGYSQAPVVVVEDGTGQDHWSGFRPDQIDRVVALSR